MFIAQNKENNYIYIAVLSLVMPEYINKQQQTKKTNQNIFPARGL